MRTSCNGCRVLRKGCGEDCSIKACLEWIRSPDSQANATVFLAKFYGRAGLMNLINAGPHQIRPAIFKSLLYDACGRIVSPIFGSVGLISSGNWQLCQDAVEAVLRGDPITRTGAEFAEAKNGRPLETGDIRHVNNGCTVHGSNDVHRVRNRFRFRRSASKPKRRRVCVEENAANEKECNRSPSHDSSISQQSDMAGPHVEEPTSEAWCSPSSNSDNEIELDLTLSLKPTKAAGARKMEQRLDYSVS